MSVIGKKRKDGDGKYSMFSDTRFPSMVMSPSCKRQRTKHDIVGYSDDETEEKSKFDGTRRAIIDQIVNSSVKPSPAASHAISKVPVIPSKSCSEIIRIDHKQRERIVAEERSWN